MEFAKAKMKAILKKNGASRVSEDALKELGKTLEKYAGYISEEATGQANEDGRKTVRKEDVIEAAK